MKLRASIVITILFCWLQIIPQERYESTWESIDSRSVPTWFVDAKFGIFIHWGVYSVPSWAPTSGDVYDKYAEWYWARMTYGERPTKSFIDFHNDIYGEKMRYQDFTINFKAELFNPDQWAEIFRNAGAKYVVLTSKHHDGFTLWPSAQSPNWNSVDLHPRRDLCHDLSTSVKNAGLKMGFYYSLYEWFHPLYKKDIENYVDNHMLPQMKDLVNKYNPDLFWTDGEWDHSSEVWKSTKFLSWLFNDSPVREHVVVNDRWGKETRGKHGGFYTTEYDICYVDDKNTMHPWEECRGIGGSFGYNRNENLEDYETSESLIHVLIEKVASGGNLLLNVGPTADGRIPVIMQQRLSDIGAWLKVNGEAIYGTRMWSNAPEINFETTHYFTSKGNSIYLIVTKWQDKPLVVEGVDSVTDVSMLGYSGRIKYKKTGRKLTIIPPRINPANNPCDNAWVFRIKQE